MPAFFTRSSFGQPQPQVAQLPFSQFGGERPILPTDTTGGLPFPDAGQPQPQPQPPPAPFSPFRGTGLSDEELDALLGRSPQSKQDVLAVDPFFSPLSRLSPLIQQQIAQPSSSLPVGGIPFEGSGGFDKLNPVSAGGLPLNNLNLVQPPNLSTANPDLLTQNKFGGFFGGF